MPTWSRAANWSAPSRPAFRRTRSSFPASARPSPRCAAALELGIKCFNLESEPELERLSDVAVVDGQGGAGLGAHQPRCRCRHPRQDLDRQDGEQVRHSLRPGPRGLCAASPPCPASRRSASTCISAARSPTWRRSTMPSRCWPNWSATCGPTATTSAMSMSAAGSASPITTTRPRRPIRWPMPQIVQAPYRRRSGVELVLEPGRLIVGNAGILVTRVEYVKEGEQDLRHRRCGDERPDPPHALRGASRHPAGGAFQPAARSPPTSSARSARPATIIAQDRTHARASRKATCWR